MERSCKKSNIFRMEFEFIAVALILTLFQLGYLFLNYANASDGIAVDREENIYVTYRGLGSVYKYANNGSLTATWTNTHPTMYTAEFVIINASLKEPTDIAVDDEGNVYILDLILGVQKFNGNGTFLARWGGDYSTDDYSEIGQHSIAVDKEGNVYVITPGDMIQKFNGNGTLLARWGAPATNIRHINNNEFILPSAVAVDKQDNVYVGDMGDFRIQKFTSNGTFITSWKTHADDINQAFIQATPQLMDLAVDQEGNIFATDGGWVAGAGGRNPNIQKFSNNGTLIPAFTEYIKNNSDIFPTGIDIDENDNVYVSSSSRNFKTLKFSNNGTFIAGFGQLGQR